MHRYVAAACVAAGVGLLAGVGWALLALGALVWLLAPPGTQPVNLAAVMERARGLSLRARQAPRRTAAVTSVSAGLSAIPAGVLVVGGLGMASIVGGSLLVGFGVLTGWNA